jgi:hypothetical protein
MESILLNKHLRIMYFVIDLEAVLISSVTKTAEVVFWNQNGHKCHGIVVCRFIARQRPRNKQLYNKEAYFHGNKRIQQ